MQTGKINVQTENIFPVIKKFLYSDNEIFLREIVSNAVDATQKLRTLVTMGKAPGVELGDITVEIKLDKDQKTLTVSDHGIGMTAEEVDKYINQIAFSSAEEFLEKYKGQDAHALIGHFGLGFYSAFMISDKVEINTLSYQSGSKAVHWECTGSPDYTLSDGDRTERGTDIIMHISEDAAEFLDEYRVLNILKKYCRFLPVPIRFGNEKHYEKKEGEEKEVEVERPRIINNTDPLWKKQPASLKQEDYTKFYHELYPANYDEPLFQIHLNIDYPFNLTGVLYFPKLKQTVEVQKNKIHLYCNQVFITDQLEGIVPEFLTLLHGVIDSPDIPLNVSRSYLQGDANVRKISSHITKKVADKLEEMFKNDRADFEKKWDDIRVFIQYGMLTDEKFYDRAIKFSLLKDIDGKYYTIDEYREKIAALQTNKDGDVIYLYANNKEAQYSYIAACQEKGYNVLLLDGILDSHFVNLLEQKFEKTRFTRVDADTVEKLIVTDEIIPAKLSDEEQKQLKEIFTNNIENKNYMVVVENMGENESPVMITQPEFMRRFRDMQQLSGQAQMGDFDVYNLVVNGNHSIAEKILKETDSEKQKNLVCQLTDLALLSQNLLKGERLMQFVKRSVDLMD